MKTFSEFIKESSGDFLPGRYKKPEQEKRINPTFIPNYQRNPEVRGNIDKYYADYKAKQDQKKPVADKTVERPFPDMPPQKQFGQDTKMKLLKIDRKISADIAKMDEPAKVQPKVGSLAVKQTGYPAAKKQAAPIPKARPANLIPKKPQSFKQAFAAAEEGSKFKWTNPRTGKTGIYLRKTKKTRR